MENLQVMFKNIFYGESRPRYEHVSQYGMGMQGA